VLHVYGVLLIEHLPQADEFWANTLVQIVLVVSIAAVLYGARHLPLRRRPMTAAAARPLAA
jgi:hypothetical protein